MMFQSLQGLILTDDYMKESEASSQSAKSLQTVEGAGAHAVGGAASIHAVKIYKPHVINFWRFADAGAAYIKTQKISRRTMVDYSVKNESADFTDFRRFNALAYFA